MKSTCKMIVLTSLQKIFKPFYNNFFRLEMVHHVEIDDKLGEAHIMQRLKALRESDARILLVYSTAARMRHIFDVTFKT